MLDMLVQLQNDKKSSVAAGKKWAGSNITLIISGMGEEISVPVREEEQKQ